MEFLNKCDPIQIQKHDSKQLFAKFIRQNITIVCQKDDVYLWLESDLDYPILVPVAAILNRLDTMS